MESEALSVVVLLVVAVFFVSAFYFYLYTRSDLHLEIKERLKREDSLRKSEERLKTIIQNEPACIKTVAPDGTLLAMNPAGLSFIEANDCPEKVIGRNVMSLIHPDDAEIFLALHRRVCFGESGTAQFRTLGLKGGVHWMETYSAPLRSSDGTIESVLSVTHDISERKQAEAKLLQSYEELKAAKLAADVGARAKSEFLANMSHEIRTPIGAILGFSELMLNPELKSDERTKYLNTILTSGRHLLKIIDEILDISKFEMGQMEAEKLDVDMTRLLKDVWDLMIIKAETKGVALQFNFKSEVPQHILSDPMRLRQILINVLSNAIKFTEKGHVTLEVSWQGELDGKTPRIKFRVIDTGIGVAPDLVRSSFQPFTQGNSSISRRFGGTGLGLALAQNFARLLGGDVYLEKSELGSGSVFGIEVSAGTVTGTEFISKFDGTLGDNIQVKNAAGDAHLLDGIKVLLVEDSPINQILISRFLTMAGAQVDFAKNGFEGLKKAIGGDFGVVLMDIQMPEMDGYEATIKLRDIGYKRPIIALTAHAMKEDRERCLKAGMSDYLTKPIDREMLIGQVLNYSHH